MAIGSIGNVLAGGGVRRAVSTREVERALRPVTGIEEFARKSGGQGPTG